MEILPKNMGTYWGKKGGVLEGGFPPNGKLSPPGIRRITDGEQPEGMCLRCDARTCPQVASGGSESRSPGPGEPLATDGPPRDR